VNLDLDISSSKRRQTIIIRGTKETNMFRRNLISSSPRSRIFMLREN